jgi:hypothetical protein
LELKPKPPLFQTCKAWVLNLIAMRMPKIKRVPSKKFYLLELFNFFKISKKKDSNPFLKRKGESENFGYITERFEGNINKKIY